MAKVALPNSVSDTISHRAYFTTGDCRNSQPAIDEFPTDKLSIGQRLDGTGLYYYNARYYDPAIGRFISADTVVPDAMNPQAFNRYSYCINNPLKYVDPSGHVVVFKNQAYLLSLFEDGIFPNSLPEHMIREWLRIRAAWGRLREAEPEYTQHMIDSEITFTVVDIDVPTQTIAYEVDMPGEVSFSEPVELRLVDDDWWSIDYQVMDALGAAGLSVYPSPLMIRTDKDITSEYFTWLVAHESYHRWEQIPGPRRWLFWYLFVELPIYGRGAGLPSERRANDYADSYFPYD